MPVKLGLVGLCTSHPQNWVPIIRKLAGEGVVDIEVTAAWDSGETRPAGHTAAFCREFNISHTVDNLQDMVELVDCAIVHTANWDHHIVQAMPFVEADIPVLIDKPLAGNPRDINQLLDWAARGKRITGGSSLRFARELRDFVARPVDERGELHTAFGGCAVDDYNYGVHAYSMLSALMGPGIVSVRYLGASRQKHLQIKWGDGKIGYLSVGKVEGWLPFHITAITTQQVEQIQVDSGGIYRSLLEACLPYLCRQADEPPLPMEVLIEPELAALAARRSRLDGGVEVGLEDLELDDPGYDGDRFAAEYRRARLATQ